ncbi:MAG TPA: GntR family transcriptional regulator [Solibacterales bacterium]|nr:GntR family transcriptional regulator [Bryobacterales bacterium]
MPSALAIQLDLASGVPAYRQVIDQILMAISTGVLAPGGQLPTVRQLAVDLSINPNTVVRAYRELEIRGILTTQQGIGTFVSRTQVPANDALRQKRLNQMTGEFVARAGREGFTLSELIERLEELSAEKRSES